MWTVSPLYEAFSVLGTVSGVLMTKAFILKL